MAEAVANRNAPGAMQSGAAHITFLAVLYGLTYFLFFKSIDAMIGLAGFSLWFPAAGLRFALIFVFGWRFGLLAAVAEIIVQGLLGEWAHWFDAPAFIVAGISAPPLIYSAVIGILHHFRLISTRFEKYHHVLWFVGAAVAAPMLAAPVSTAIQILGGRLPAQEFGEAALSFWIGDMIGILMAAPVAMLVFSLWQADSSRSSSFGAALRERRFWLELASLTALTGALAFWRPGFLELTKGLPFALPVLWMALRFGFKGAAFVVLVVNILIVPVALHVGAEARLESQILLAFLSITGLIMGGLVTARLHTEKQLEQQALSNAHTDRLAVMGDMASQIIHEIVQPTSITSMYAKETEKMLASGNYTPEQIGEAMNRIAIHTDRLNSLIASMKQFATKGEISRVRTDTRKLVVGIRDLIDIYAKSMGAHVTYDLTQPLPVSVDEVQMQQAIMNLAKNAIEAMATSKTKSLTIATFPKGSLVCISVADTGPGLPSDFEIGTSTKTGGMGLGLKITKAILEAHGGTLSWPSPNEAVIILPSA